MTSFEEKHLPAHSILGASSMYRWEACAGSVALCRDLIAPQSDYADEGTLAHLVMAYMLKGERVPANLSFGAFQVTGEMLDYVKGFCDQVTDDFLYRAAERKMTPAGRIIQLPTGHPDKMFIEHRFDISSIFPGCFGTADVVTWHEKLKLLTVYDLKYGAGHVVEVEFNTQLMYYALGALITLGFPAIDIEMVVGQPRAKHKKGPIRRWRIPSSDILFDFSERLVRAAQKTQDPNAPLVEGRHCWFCPARQLNKCPILHEKAVEKAMNEFDEVSDDSGFWS